MTARKKTTRKKATRKKTPKKKAAKNKAAEKSVFDGKLSAYTFVITGTLEFFSRAEAQAAIESHGGKVVGSISGKTNCAVVGADPGSKADKARKLGLMILDEAAFGSLVGAGAGKKSTKKKGAGKKATKKSTKKAKAKGKSVAPRERGSRHQIFIYQSYEGFMEDMAEDTHEEALRIDDAFPRGVEHRAQLVEVYRKDPLVRDQAAFLQGAAEAAGLTDTRTLNIPYMITGEASFDRISDWTQVLYGLSDRGLEDLDDLFLSYSSAQPDFHDTFLVVDFESKLTQSYDYPGEYDTGSFCPGGDMTNEDYEDPASIIAQGFLEMFEGEEGASEIPSNKNTQVGLSDETTYSIKEYRYELNEGNIHALHKWDETPVAGRDAFESATRTLENRKRTIKEWNALFHQWASLLVGEPLVEAKTSKPKPEKPSASSAPINKKGKQKEDVERIQRIEKSRIYVFEYVTGEKSHTYDISGADAIVGYDRAMAAFEGRQEVAPPCGPECVAPAGDTWKEWRHEMEALTEYYFKGKLKLDQDGNATNWADHLDSELGKGHLELMIGWLIVAWLGDTDEKHGRVVMEDHQMFFSFSTVAT